MHDPGGISVIICSYNGESRLPQSLKYLANQQFTSAVKHELILVNNNSSDNTRIIAETEWQKYQTNWTSFRIIDEQQPGLSFARQKGIDASEYEYIIFCDDDNWLDKHYVDTAYSIISSHHAIAAVGGQSTATALVLLPLWFENSKANYAVGQQADASGDVTAREYLWGSGIVIRKSLYQFAYRQFPSLLTGRKGKSLSAGEDAEMCLRFIIMGYKLYYSEALKFQHFISENRLTEEYNKKLQQGFYEAYDVLTLYSGYLSAIRINLFNKFFLLFRSALKLILFKKLMEKEKLNIFLLLGIKYKSMDYRLMKIKYFSKQKKW